MHAFSHSVRYFEEVAAQKSIRRAAERLNIAPSAVTRQIARFEEQLGAPLFERLARGVRLTAAGEVMLAQIRRMQRDFGAAIAQVDASDGPKKKEDGLRIPVDPHDLFNNILLDPQAPGELVAAFMFYLQEKLGFKKHVARSKLYEAPTKALAEK